MPDDRQFSFGDLEALTTANRLCDRWWKWGPLFYRLKTRLLHEYGEVDGYDLQQWGDYNREYCNCAWGTEPENCNCGGTEEYATHYHILRRWKIGDVVFHIPTSEWAYWNMSYGFKKSDNYEALRAQVGNDIEGRKKSITSRSSPERWRALKHLVRRYGWMLKAE